MSLYIGGTPRQNREALRALREKLTGSPYRFPNPRTPRRGRCGHCCQAVSLVLWPRPDGSIGPRWIHDHYDPYDRHSIPFVYAITQV